MMPFFHRRRRRRSVFRCSFIAGSVCECVYVTQ